MRLRTATTTLLLVAAALVAACGSDDEQGDPIPAATAAELEKRLASVEDRFDFGGGACDDIPEDQELVNQAIDSLPAGTDQDVRDALQEGFDRLFELTSEQCEEEPAQDTTEETDAHRDHRGADGDHGDRTPADRDHAHRDHADRDRAARGRRRDTETPESGGGGGVITPEDDG